MNDVSLEIGPRPLSRIGLCQNGGFPNNQKGLSGIDAHPHFGSHRNLGDRGPGEKPHE
jgi:hypothetical protein